MRRLTPTCLALVVLPALLSVEATPPSDNLAGKTRDRSPISQDLSPDRTLVATANHTSGTVSVVALSTGRVLFEAHCGGRPIDVAWWDSDTLLASCLEDDTVMVFRWTGDRLQPIKTIAVGNAPRGLAVTRSPVPGSQPATGRGKKTSPECRAFVALSGEDAIAEFDPNSGRCVRRFPTGGQPSWLTPTPNGLWLVACANVPGEVWVHDIRTGQKLSRRTIFDDGFNLGRPVVLSDSETIILPTPINRSFPVHETNVRRGWVIDNRLTRMPLPGGEYWQQKQMNLDEHGAGCGDLNAVALSPDRKWLIGTCGGSHELVILRFQELPWPSADPGDFLPEAMRDNPHLFRRVELGGRPVDPVFLDNHRVLVANYFDNSLQVIDVASAEITRTMTLGPAGPLSLVRQGEQIFHDADRSRDGWFSCSTCHPDGHTNGQTFDTVNDGNHDTYKLVPSLRGVTRTGPWTWHGWQQSLPASIRKSLHDTLSTEDNPTDTDIQAVIAYLGSLRHPRSRHLRADGGLSPAAARGQQLFQTTASCTDCHAGRDFTTAATYKVGLESPRLFYPEFNPPSLRGLHAKRRFLHDGRARSLRDVLTKHHRPEKLTGKPLSKQQLEDLIAYLLSI